MVPARAFRNVPTNEAESFGAPGSSVWNDVFGHLPSGAIDSAPKMSTAVSVFRSR